MQLSHSIPMINAFLKYDTTVTDFCFITKGYTGITHQRKYVYNDLGTELL